MRITATFAFVAIGFWNQPFADAAHPTLPAFERFFADATDRDLEAGAYLLGELSCVKCHAAEQNVAIATRTAPILDDIGSRVQVDHLRKFIADPQQTKPGTLMPNLLAGGSESERADKIEALVHFLASTGTLKQSAPNQVAVKNGERWFHSLGCVACHGSRKEGAKELATSVPLGNLVEKYSIPSLTQFLKNPHAARPSGRMPSLNLRDSEALEIAAYLLKEIEAPVNMNYAVFEGGWNEVPDFAAMTPKSEGQCVGFDLGVAQRENNFGIRFTGYLHLEKTGEYRFEIGSDDGSRLWIDGQDIVDVDGVHPHSTRMSKPIRYEAGVYPIVVDYFQGGGEWTLEVNYQGPGISKQPLDSAISPTREKPKVAPDGFQLDAAKVEQGRTLFTSVGCANCHQLKENGALRKSSFVAPPLAKLDASKGCLGANPPVQFDLSKRQTAAIRTALSHLDEIAPLQGERSVFQTMSTFNCYACHERNAIGGVERERDADFVGTIPEMGDEGRIPPSLTGAGDKLNDNWLKEILNRGAQDRPYMLTRMPRFGANHVSGLLTAFPELDRKTEAARAEFDQPEYRVKAEGRLLVGEKGLSCVKCHPFGNSQATGIQALNLQSMTNRLREDWFTRYMINPQEYRRGTRMPSAWPNGRTILPAILDGSTQKQLSAIWLYLSDGDKAAVPLGLGGQSIVLQPSQKPIVYRNFIDGLSPRGIAVGYPEEAHLAFDTERFGIRLIWHGAFIDASRHWSGRGQGFEGPLGDHVVRLVEGIPFARLDSLDAEWPAGTARETGYDFNGYKLDDAGRPTFLFEFAGIAIADFPQPKKGDKDAYFTRTISLRSSSAPRNLYWRVGRGKIERIDAGRFVVDGILKLRVPADALVRESAGASELLVPVTFEDGSATLEIDYLW